jgi:hypothetical protein
MKEGKKTRWVTRVSAPQECGFFLSFFTFSFHQHFAELGTREFEILDSHGFSRFPEHGCTHGLRQSAEQILLSIIVDPPFSMIWSGSVSLRLVVERGLPQEEERCCCC